MCQIKNCLFLVFLQNLNNVYECIVFSYLYRQTFFCLTSKLQDGPGKQYLISIYLLILESYIKGSLVYGARGSLWKQVCVKFLSWDIIRCRPRPPTQQTLPLLIIRVQYKKVLSFNFSILTEHQRMQVPHPLFHLERDLHSSPIHQVSQI